MNGGSEAGSRDKQADGLQASNLRGWWWFSVLSLNLTVQRTKRGVVDRGIGLVLFLKGLVRMRDGLTEMNTEEYLYRRLEMKQAYQKYERRNRLVMNQCKLMVSSKSTLSIPNQSNWIPSKYQLSTLELRVFFFFFKPKHTCRLIVAIVELFLNIAAVQSSVVGKY